MLLLRRIPVLGAMPWRYRINGVAEAADELPVTLLPRTAMLVGTPDKANWVAFDCPRHSSERILLNLSATRRPHWTVNSEGLLTIAPSIDAIHRGSRCHFWIRRGKVRWTED